MTKLDERPTNLTCVAHEAPQDVDAAIAVTDAFPKLPTLADIPVSAFQAPGDDSRWYVLEYNGRIRVFANDPDVGVFEQDYIDLSSRVGGGKGALLGMAFHPDFAQNREVFLYWVEYTPVVSTVARFRELPDGGLLDPSSEQEVIRIDQPWNIHPGGRLAFGPDRYLYVGMGEGGSFVEGQNTTNLLGSFLRLDVDSARPYAIPPDNPFAGNPVCPADNSSLTDCPEIYAWGFRHPWGWSFDAASQRLWVADVGFATNEEIDIVERGGNYGWDCREGTAEYRLPETCPAWPDLIDPVFEYDHTDGDASIIGGYVYRGTAIPNIVGDYVFGDFGSGRMWRLVEDGSGGYEAERLLDTGIYITSFAQGNDGELYILGLWGRMYRVTAAPEAPPVESTVPTLLSETGCVDLSAPTEPAPGLIPFDVAAPFWSDNAVKERWLAIPDGTSVAVDSDGNFQFPAGSVLVKNFRIEGDLVETRLLMRHLGGEWAGYSYEWNDEQTDATLVTGGKVKRVGDEDWIFPGGNECMRCHTRAAGFALGPNVAQLNHAFIYPPQGPLEASFRRQIETGRLRGRIVPTNQVTTLSEIGVLATPIHDPSVLPALPAPDDQHESVDARARAYLHANCAQCHRPGGPTPASIDLRFDVALSQTNICDVEPRSSRFGIDNARIVAPGDPARSVLLSRMTRRDAHGMPPLASNIVDETAADLIERWIASLTVCR